MRLIYFTVLSFLGLFLVSPLRSEEGVKPANRSAVITVAAAADLRFVLPKIVEIFQQKNPDIRVEIIYGASGKFYEQVIRGAPFDLFFSADREYPSLLASKGYSVGEPFEYAEGKLVVWMHKDQFKKEEQANWKDLLLNRKVLKIAIANPERAPYGKAAKAALIKAGLWDRLKEKMVMGENVIQAFQFAEAKNAQIAFVPLSLALSPKAKTEGVFVEVPHQFYPRILQYGLIIKRTADFSIAERFKDFLFAENSRRILKEYGLLP